MYSYLIISHKAARATRSYSIHVQHSEGCLHFWWYRAVKGLMQGSLVVQGSQMVKSCSTQRIFGSKNVLCELNPRCQLGLAHKAFWPPFMVSDSTVMVLPQGRVENVCVFCPAQKAHALVKQSKLSPNRTMFALLPSMVAWRLRHDMIQRYPFFFFFFAVSVLYNNVPFLCFALQQVSYQLV